MEFTNFLTLQSIRYFEFLEICVSVKVTQDIPKLVLFHVCYFLPYPEDTD